MTIIEGLTAHARRKTDIGNRLTSFWEHVDRPYDCRFDASRLHSGAI